LSEYSLLAAGPRIINHAKPGGLSIFEKDLADSIKSSHLSALEITTLNQNLDKTVKTIKNFIDSLNGARNIKRGCATDIC
jgi:hypothetical protein